MTSTTRRRRNSSSEALTNSLLLDSTTPSSEVVFTRFFKRYKTVCLILLFLFLIQVLLTIRFVLIQNDQKKGASYEGLATGKHSNRFPAHKIYVEEDKSGHDLNVEGKTSQDENKKKKNNQQVPANHSQADSSPNRSSPLDLASLGFVPRCHITSKESISAIQRAKTQTCKQHLVETACQLIEGSLYPIRLPRFCHSKQNTYMKNVGCYKDDQKNRVLPDLVALLKLSNSPQNCVDLCLRSGFAFAGVQYSIECFCGNIRPSNSLMIKSDECNMVCPSSNQSNCGGYYTIDIYETGVFNLSNQNNLRGLDDVKRELSSQFVSEREVARIVFFLTLNGRGVRQVVRLIKALFRPHHYFYIHVDARQDYLFRELQKILKQKLPHNVQFMTTREATIWGGASLLNVLLRGMEDLIINSPRWNWNWDYVINLSESDFPLKTIEQLDSFLALNRGRNFLKSHGKDVQKFITKQGLDKTFVECENRMWRIGDRKLPVGVLYDGGSDWIALHHDFVNYIVKGAQDQLVGGLRVVFKYALLPAESFFHTLLRNSEFCETFADNNLHVTNWKRKLGCKCQYRSIVDWCGCSPNDFRLADWNRLEATDSRITFFGRKFEAVVNQAIINKLELKLYPDRQDYGTEDKYWQSLYHYEDKSPKPSDALLTLSHSLARISLGSSPGRFLDRHHHPEFGWLPIKVFQMHVFNQHDTIEGLLVNFRIQVSKNKSIEMESWFKVHRGWATYIEDEDERGVKEFGRIQNIRVGEDYDQKEQLFRNHAGMLGPFSEPTIAYNIYSNENFNITFVWINPENAIKNVMNVSVGVGETANFVKPVLKRPLAVGNWTVKIQTPMDEVIASVKFLISPLQFQEGNPLQSFQDHLYLSRYKTIQELESSIDSFVSTYYTLQDICVADDERLLDNMAGNHHDHAGKRSHVLETKTCGTTHWSSFYPDPKGTIERIDDKTGLLLP